jgi:hypothetical protein
MTTRTRLIPPLIRTQLNEASDKLKLAYNTGDTTGAAKILAEIDDLLDQIGGYDEWP